MLPTKIDKEAIRANWASQGFSCEVWIEPPDHVCHDFQHDVDLMILLLEGEIQVELPGRTIRLSIGDELIIPAHTRHTVRNRVAQPARWLHGYRRSA